MKKLFLFSLVASMMLLYSCGRSKEDIVRSNVEDLILPLMDDPRSYEFASIELIEQLTNYQLIAQKIDDYDHAIAIAQILLDGDLSRQERMREHRESGSTVLFNQADYERVSAQIVAAQGRIERNTNIIAALENLKANFGETLHDVAANTFRFSFRGANALGATVLNTIYVQTDNTSEFNIVYLADTRDELLSVPVEVEGWANILSRYPRID